MARHISPQKKRNKTISSPHQRIISQFFTPKSGISKEEVNFLVKANSGSRGNCQTTGVQVRPDQITLSPAFGFTTAAKIHQQAGGCYSRTKNQQILSGQRNLGSTTCKCAVSGDVICACSPLKNSSSDKKQTHFDLTRAFGFMASSTSSSSSSPTSSSSPCPSPRTTRRTRRSNSRAQNHLKGKSAKKQKRVPETISVDSEDENCISDDDCCVIMNVVRGRKLKSDSEVEESSSCSQSSTSTESSSQESKGESSDKSSTSSSESDQKNTTSSCKKSSLSSKSARQTKGQASAKSTFGLVGGDVSNSDDDDDDDSEDLSQCDSDFAQLPVEIMENIFCQLPIVDLMLNCALVCRQWYDIISRDSVMALIFSCIVAQVKFNLT